MRILEILELVLGIILLSVLMHFIRPYVPSDVLPILSIFEVLLKAVTSIIRIVIDAIIQILQMIKGILPT